MESEQIGGIEGYMIEFLGSYARFLEGIEKYGPELGKVESIYPFENTPLGHTEVEIYSPNYYPFDSKLKVLRRGTFEELLVKERELKEMFAKLEEKYLLKATPYFTNLNGSCYSIGRTLEQLPSPPQYYLFIDGIEFPLNEKQNVLCVPEYSKSGSRRSLSFGPKMEFCIYFNPRPNMPLNKLDDYEPRAARGYENKAGSEKGLFHFDLLDDVGYFQFDGDDVLEFEILLDGKFARPDFCVIRAKESVLGSGAINAFLDTIGQLEVIDKPN